MKEKQFDVGFLSCRNEFIDSYDKIEQFFKNNPSDYDSSKTLWIELCEEISKK